MCLNVLVGSIRYAIRVEKTMLEEDITGNYIIGHIGGLNWKVSRETN